MKCPICEIELVMTDRQGIEIDYCSKCRGIWLDRGELDKIIEKSAPIERVDNSSFRESREFFRGDDDRHHHDNNNHGYSSHSGGRKKKGILGELFDF